MSNRSYKIIFVLLTFCVLSILGLQAFWLRNFYDQKKAQFTASIYEAMEDIVATLREKEKAGVIRKRMVTITNTAGNYKEPLLLMSDNDHKVNGVKVIQLGSKTKRVVITDSISSAGSGVPGENAVRVMESGMTGKGKEKTKTYTITKDPVGHPPGVTKAGMFADDDFSTPEERAEVYEVFEKMIREIEVMDTDEIGEKELRSVISEALVNKGILEQFEFSLRHITDRGSKTIVQSADFNPKEKSFKGDLSAKKIFRNNKYLSLQFPGESAVMMSEIKGSALLSVFFSLLILSAFYYTMRLIRKQKKLSEIKSDFVNNMTHELKTPIATISLALDAMSNPIVKNNEAQFSTYSRILKEENRKLNTHVERVLQMSLLEKGELQLARRPVPLATLIRNSISSYHLQATVKKAEITFSEPGDDLVIEGDELHLQAVINNLLDNALKYSGEGCRISIRAARNEKMILLSVKDNGIGMSREEAGRIFEKFYRAQGGNLHDVKGFGLGLSYVKSVVEAHNGSIRVESAKGSGSEFIITFDINA